MRCPYCGNGNTRVIDSRPAEDGDAIRRRRECETCGKRFTTYEKVETIPVIVIKKDDNRETYDRTKIEKGVIRACHKRPISAGQIGAMLDEIEAALDDVNVYRFAEYLKKFSKSTQFLVITHRKGTMEAADTVYGVTMEENGISKLLSMKLM